MNKWSELWENVSVMKGQKEYWKNVLAISLSTFGDGIESIAFPILIFKLTGSTMLMAITFALNACPNILFGLISGVFSMKHEEKWIMVICDIGSGTCFALIALLFYYNVLILPIAYLLAFLNACFLAFRTPAALSIFPRILNRAYLSQGIALKSVFVQGSQMAGLILASSILAFSGVSAAIFCDAATFIFCAMLLATMKIKPKEKMDYTAKESFVEVKKGFSYVVKNFHILDICLFACFINMFLVPVEIYQVPFIEVVLKQKQYLLSVMGISIAVGMIIGGFMTPFIKKIFQNRKGFLCSGFFMTAGFLLLVLTTMVSKKGSVFFLIVSMSALGVGVAIAENFIQILMYEMVAEKYLSRTGAVANMLATFSMPLASALSGVVLLKLSITQLYGVCGIIVLIIYLIHYKVCKFDEIMENVASESNSILPS